ncbi:MAG: hypothetical protein WD906_01255 [Anaerolineales bacterium]
MVDQEVRRPRYRFLHPFLVAGYPALALWVHNREQVSSGVILRPMLVSLGLAAGLLVVWHAIWKDWDRAAVSTTLQVLLFSTYGHVYLFLKEDLLLPADLIRHRYLLPIFALLWLVGVGSLFRRRSVDPAVSVWFTRLAMVMVALPLGSLAIDAGTHLANPPRNSWFAEEASSQLHVPESPPDIYYIILDTYTREDTLLKDYHFDNSTFLRRLEEMGFWVAECARSNYPSTQESLTSSLNMDYLRPLRELIQARGLGGAAPWFLLRDSRVRALLESAGYTTIGFDTGYEWSRLRDADLYLGPEEEAPGIQAIEPFESLLMQTTMLLAVMDAWRQQESSVRQGMFQALESVAFPHAAFVKRQLYILETLPTLARLPGAKFTFAHILIPHVPRVFSPNGEITTDRRYYGGPLDGAVNSEYDIRGYLNEIEFVNRRLLGIVEQIISESANPPIVLIQGDTGRGGVGAFEILSAYYLRGEQRTEWYPGVSPVNSFRIVFNAFFGTQFDLLPDQSYETQPEEVGVFERWPACQGR